MADKILGSKNAALWQLRGKLHALRDAIDECRATRLQTARERADRDYQALCRRWWQLIEDGERARNLRDDGAIRRIAGEVASFYREWGDFERAVDSLISQISEPQRKLTRTG